MKAPSSSLRLLVPRPWSTALFLGLAIGAAQACAGADRTAMEEPHMDVIARVSEPTVLQAAPVQLELKRAGDGGRESGQALASVLASRRPDRRPTLVLRGLRAETPPGVLYHLYLGLEPGESPAPDDPRHIGVVNFFDAERGKPGFYSFDLERALEALRAAGPLPEPLTVTVIPAGAPDAEARPVIGSAELVLQPISP
jgi:hypothetical protein